MHESLLPGMNIKLISSAAHGRCHSLPPSILSRLILLETTDSSNHPAQACHLGTQSWLGIVPRPLTQKSSLHTTTPSCILHTTTPMSPLCWWLNTFVGIQSNHIVWIFQVLILENDSFKREIVRLKRDNADLIRRSKKSEEERTTLQVSGQTSF